jgi:hypothetical protein
MENMVQEVQHFPSKLKVLKSNPNVIKTQKPLKSSLFRELKESGKWLHNTIEHVKEKFLKENNYININNEESPKLDDKSVSEKSSIFVTFTFNYQ